MSYLNESQRRRRLEILLVRIKRTHQKRKIILNIVFLVNRFFLIVRTRRVAYYNYIIPFEVIDFF